MAGIRLQAAITFPLPRIAGGAKALLPNPSIPNRRRFTSTVLRSALRFTWDDALRAAEDSPEDDDHPSDLGGYFHKVRICNRGSELQSEFVPFVVEDQVVGYIHKGFTKHLKEFPRVFTSVPRDGDQDFGGIALHASLTTAEDRTRAVDDVVKSMGELIPGIRNEHYPVVSAMGMPAFFLLERAAAPYFGIKAFGVHMNGYVNINGQKFLWVGKRSDEKPTYPGMLDHLVAGGLPHGISCRANLFKECEEEAGIPRSISCRAIPVGAVSYMDIDGWRCKRDVLLCYDLELPAEFVPNNEDGEVDSFRLIPINHVASIIQKTEFFKPNCCICIIDFLFRHGFISPDEPGYLKLLKSLRSGDCS